MDTMGITRPFSWDEQGNCISSPVRGIIYTSYINILDTKKFLNYKGEIMIIARQLPIDKMKLMPQAIHNLKLAPSEKLFNDYKSCKISWIEFERKFNEDLEFPDLIDVINIINRGYNVLLLCYEKSDKFCHRRLVGEKFKKLGYKVKEL